MVILSLLIVLLPILLAILAYSTMGKEQPKSDINVPELELNKPKSELNANHKSNDFQKILLGIGITSFFIWVLLAIGNNALSATTFGSFINRAIYSNLVLKQPYAVAGIVNLVLFCTWVGSIIAYFIYKD